MKKSIVFSKSAIYIFLLVVFSILCLIYDEPKESLFLTFSIVIFIIIIKDREKIFRECTVYNIVLSFILSYFVAVLFISTRGYSMNLSVIGRSKENNGKAVLLVYEGEPEMYSVEKGITNIYKNGTVKSKIFSPFILFENKRQYYKIGRSDYKRNTLKVAKELETFLSEEFEVYISYLYDTDYVEEVLVKIANDGYKNVIIVPIFLTDGQNSKILKTRIEKMKLYNLNINVKYIDTLWNSESIASIYESIIIRNINLENVGNTGVILVGEGQIGYKKDKNLKALREDIMYRNRIKSKLLNELGLYEHKIKLGWFKYVEPNYIDSLKNLLDYSVSEIVIIYTKPSVTNIENAIMSSSIRTKVDIPEGVKIIIIDGFLDDSLFIYELKNRIEFINLQKWE